MFFCETKNDPPPWFYMGLLAVAFIVSVIATYGKEIIKFWMGL